MFKRLRLATIMRFLSRQSNFVLILTAVFVLGLSPFAEHNAIATPNLVANGDLEQPPGRAESRVGPTGNVAIFEFPGERSFGRVVAWGHEAGPRLAEELAVGYGQQPGRSRVLYVDAKNVKFNGDYNISIWFDLKGQIRPNREYAYSVKIMPTGKTPDVELTMVAPAIWADGQLQGATVNLKWDEEIESYDDLARQGTVKTPNFKHQTGGQFLVLKLPENYKGQLALISVSFREIDQALLNGEKPIMPTPTRYILVDDILEEQIASVFSKTTQVLKLTQHPQAGIWQGGSTEDSVSLTARNLQLLASRGEDLNSKVMQEGIEWLVKQELAETSAISDRMFFLSQYQPVEHRQTIAADLLKLVDAQFDDGGWAERVDIDRTEDRSVRPDNLSTLSAIMGLQEAYYAGVKADLKVWRKAAAYWRDAQARDGGYRAKMDKYGGLGEATTVHNTALGLCGLLITLDMAYAADARTCNQYLASSAHLESMESALDWLENYYDEYFKMLPDLNSDINPFLNAGAMQVLYEQSGITEFKNKNVFRTEAERIIPYYDENSGLFGGSVQLSSYAMDLLSMGSRPTAFQRTLIGGNPEHIFARDGYHLARYLRTQRLDSVNWRAVDLDRPIAELVTVPIFYINVVGNTEDNNKQWNKLRDYCFGGGVVVINIAEDAESERAAIIKKLEEVFPEYPLQDLAKDDSILKIKHELTVPKGMKVIGNGLKNFVFIPQDDWSCRLNNYQIEEHKDTFEFFDNLLAYTLDSEKPRPNFLPSTWDTGAAAVMDFEATQMNVGRKTAPFPHMLEILDRTMRSECRLEVKDVSKESAPKNEKLLWLSCCGPEPITDEQLKRVRDKVEAGTFLFAEVLTGNTDWAETFRSDLLKLGDDVRIRRLLANHPILTGKVYETYGYDLRITPVRKALRDVYEKLPRLEMYVIEKGDKEIGVFTVHDVGSGLGYVMYPECRGAMPDASRKLAINVVLYSMQHALEEAGKIHR